MKKQYFKVSQFGAGLIKAKIRISSFQNKDQSRNKVLIDESVKIN